jgi:hypothetical protein
MEVLRQIPSFLLIASIVPNEVVSAVGIHGFDRPASEGDAVFAA